MPGTAGSVGATSVWFPPVSVTLSWTVAVTVNGAGEGVPHTVVQVGGVYPGGGVETASVPITSR